MGVTLRYKCIKGRCLWSRSGARPPFREAILPRSLSGVVNKKGDKFSLYNVFSSLSEAVQGMITTFRR